MSLPRLSVPVRNACNDRRKPNIACVSKRRSVWRRARIPEISRWPCADRALTGQSHNCKRHGATTLFAALDIATGAVTGKQYARRRRAGFLDFTNAIVAASPGREIPAVLDNPNTQKPGNDQWPARHPNVHFHFTPTSASWLNQVEIWFSIQAGKALRGASFSSLDQLRAHIDAFIKTYNKTARPFVRTKSEVRQKRMKPCFADLWVWVLVTRN